jgi:hypothetical protein
MRNEELQALQARVDDVAAARNVDDVRENLERGLLICARVNATCVESKERSPFGRLLKSAG